MTTPALILFILTGVLALADWAVVARSLEEDGRLLAERILKPLVMVALIGAMVTLEPQLSAPRTWFVVAACFSLAGDVFLLDPDRRFIPGLGAFLIGHLAYIGGLAEFGVEGGRMLVMVAVLVVALSFVGTRIVRGAFAQDRILGVAVGVYITVISVMTIFAAGTGRWLAVAGAVIFMVSDACIGWSRFVSSFRGQRLAIMTTYHSAQVLLALALI